MKITYENNINGRKSRPFFCVKNRNFLSKNILCETICETSLKNFSLYDILILWRKSYRFPIRKGA